MNIRINSESDVPIRDQLAEQIVFLIVTDRLKAGQQLPSVRELARRLKIHHNTVSESYQDLVRRKWLQRRRGSRLVVKTQDNLTHPKQAQSLDDLINTTIRTARLMGYSMQSLRDRVRTRLLSQPPDHILVVEQDPGLRELMREELQASLEWPIEACSREDLETNPGLSMGALAVTPQHAVDAVDALFPKDRPVVPISFCSADEHVERIRSLAQPSTIAVVSTSKVFLTVARGILAPAVGQRHSLEEVLLPNDNPGVARAADVVFCDSIAKRLMRQPKAIHYQLITPESLKYVLATVKSYMS